MLDKRKFYINGEWISPYKPNDFNIINPSNEDSFAVISLGAKEDVDKAVDAAKKANSVRTWKEGNAACVNSGKFELGAIAVLAIIVNPDHLEEVVYLYERLGHFDNIVELLEQGLGLSLIHI